MSHRTNPDFKFEPKIKTSKLIWKYLSSSNLLEKVIDIDLENKDKIFTIEKATHDKNYEEEELFTLYERFMFNINQLLTVQESYKLLPNFEARALIYQGILLTKEPSGKIKLIKLLKDLFEQDKISNAFDDKLVKFLKEIHETEVPSNYTNFYHFYLQNSITNKKKIEFNNKIIHQSKLLNYFKEDYNKKNIDKDLEYLLKKIKKNKKYFFQIKDQILLESLKADGVQIPKKYENIYEPTEANIPYDIQVLINNNEIGLALLRFVEIIGEDKIIDVDAETLYFIISALNQLNTYQLRNKILLLFWILKYDKRYSIPIIVVMIIYWVTIKSSIRTKIVEGNSFFDNFVKLPEFSTYDYSTQLPNSILHNSQDQGYSSIFSFFNGGGKYSTLKNDRMSTLEETNSLLDQLINMFEMGQENCKGGFEKLTECSRDCGYGTHEKVYRVIQEKGPNGIDCPYTDGHTIKQMCILRDCNVDEKCRNNYECRSGNCDNGTCKRVGECDEDTLYHCYTRKECLGLNKTSETYGGRYEWDSRTNTCSFESKTRVETNIYGGISDDGDDGGGGGGGEETGCNEDSDCDEGYCLIDTENNKCVECLENDNCEGGKVCNNTNECVECLEDSDCETGSICRDNICVSTHTPPPCVGKGPVIDQIPGSPPGCNFRAQAWHNCKEHYADSGADDGLGQQCKREFTGIFWCVNDPDSRCTLP